MFSIDDISTQGGELDVREIDLSRINFQLNESRSPIVPTKFRWIDIKF